MPVGAQIARLHQALDAWSHHPSYEGIWEAATYMHVGALTMDVATGIYTQAPATSYPVRVHVEDFDHTEIDNATVQPTDLLCDLTPEALLQITVALTDTITLRGAVYQIVRRYPEDGEQLHLRKAG